MQQNPALSQNQQANAANSANAFGGSRQGVQGGRHPGSRRARHGPDGGQPQRSGTSPRRRRVRPATSTAPWRPSRATRARRRRRSIPISWRARGLTASGTAQNQANAGNYAMLTLVGGAAAAAGAEPDQQPDRQIRSGLGLSAIAACDAGECARHDAARHDHLGH